MKKSRLVIGLLEGHSVEIGEDILLTLVRDGKGKTRVSIEAPVTTKIERTNRDKVRVQDSKSFRASREKNQHSSSTQ